MRSRLHLDIVHASNSQVPPPQAIKGQAGDGELELVAADDGRAPIPRALRTGPICSHMSVSVSLPVHIQRIHAWIC